MQPENLSNENKIKILVDHREIEVIQFLLSKEIEIEKWRLDAGDYILSSRVGVERKKVEDFLNSLINGNLFTQLKKLKDSFSTPILIIEGEGILTKRNINQKAIFGGLASIITDFGVSIFTSKSPSETADFLYAIARREQSERNKSIVLRGRKWSMSLSERQQFILEGFPNVSAVLAKRLLQHFGSVRAIVSASQEELCKVQGIGKGRATEIIKVLNSKYVEGN